jgi:hypothetical protein
VLFFGGLDRAGNAVTGTYLYDPVNDKWSSASTSGQPSARLDSTVAWTGTQLIVYGGHTNSGAVNATTYVYDLASDSWQRVSDGPNQRFGAFGTWDGTYLSAWSGYNNSFRSDGKLYEPVGDKWTTMGSVGQPSLRWAWYRYTGWSFRIKPNVTLMLGGYGANFDTDGGIYNSTTNGWTPVAAWPSGAAHSYGVCVWNGTEVIVWGGGSGAMGTLTTAGERYLP